MATRKAQRREQTYGSFIVELWTGQSARFHDMPRAQEWAVSRLEGQSPGAYAAFYRAPVERGRRPAGAPWTEPFHVLVVNEYGRIRVAGKADWPADLQPRREPFPYRGFEESGARETQQPDWEEVGHIGDVNWVEHGGGPVMIDRTGVYEPELEYVEPPPDDLDFEDPKARWTIYRVVLDPEVPDWGDLEDVARTVGADPSELRADFTSEDPMKRALAYESWASHYGWHEFDQYPNSFTCAEMNERYDADLDCYSGIQSEIEEEVQRQVDASAAMGWSHVSDQLIMDLEEEGFDPESIVAVAEFGDAVAVNEGIETEKTLAGVEADLEREGYELTDKGGRVPSTEGYAYGDSVIRAVARKLKLPEKQVEAAAKALDWWVEDEIPGSTSGYASIWAKKIGGAEEAKRRKPSPRVMQRPDPVEDPFFVIQGLYDDGTLVSGYEYGYDDEDTAIREAEKLARSRDFEGDYVRVITRDGDLVWQSKKPRRKPRR
jgi:hypothetical protein